MATFSAFNL